MTRAAVEITRRKAIVEVIQRNGVRVVRVTVPGPRGPRGAGVPAGGTLGQVLRRAAGADYSTVWGTLTPGDVGADPAGTAASGVAAHLAASDPHPQYTTPAEAAAAAPVQAVALAAPSGWSTNTSNSGGNVTLTLALPSGASLVSSGDRVAWDQAAATALRWDGSATGLDAAAGRGSLGLGTAAQSAASDFATAAQGALAATAVQPAALSTGLAGKVDTSDSRLSDAREWSAATISQADAEAGTGIDRRAFTAQRVFQAIASWWSSSGAAAKLAGIASGATANATDAQLRDRATHTGTQPVSTITGLGTFATANAATPPAIGGTTPAAGAFTNLSASLELTLPSGVPASPTPRDFYTVSDTLRYRDSSNVERLLLNSADNLANLGNTATARANLGAAGSGAIGSSGLTMATARVLGRSTAGAGAVEEITLGAGLNLSGTTLSSTPSGSNGQVQFNNNGVFGSDVSLTFDSTTKRLAVSGLSVGTDIVQYSDPDIADYLDVTVDLQGRVAFGIKANGEVYIPKVQSIMSFGQLHTSAGHYSVVVDSFNRAQIRLASDTSVSNLTSSGNNWNPIATAETPQRIAFQSDRTDGIQYWVMSADGTRQARATPSINDITFWGDSMTQRLQSHGHLPGLLSGRTITYNALGGTSVEHIIARQGGENATCTIPSGSIPASGAVSLRNVFPSLGYHAGTTTVGATYSYLVTIAGVQGTLTSTTNASSQADYTFTRSSSGSAVTVSGSTEIIVLSSITDAGFGFSKSNTAVFWMGTNPLSALPSTTYDPTTGTGIYFKSPATTYDPTNSSAVQARTIAITQNLINRIENLDRHALIVGPFIGQGQVWSSSTEKLAMVAGFSTFSKHWYDLRSDFIATCKTWLQTNYPSVYANWSASDDTHVANGATPGILREDTIHLNTYGSQLVSQLISSRLTTKGW